MVTHNAVQLDRVTYSIGSFAMQELSLAVRGGEYFVLTGPNGAGKTMVIKLIAGLISPAAGSVLIHERPMNCTPPWERNIGYVPQYGVLFPNRSVRGNVAFGLEMRRKTKPAIDAAVDHSADMLGIGPLLDRPVGGLSGGERQKVCLARALAIEPSLLLLDEPLSAIDEDTRDSLCRELRDIQACLGITIIHVSHNRRETEMVADRICTLTAGRVAAIMDANGGKGR